MEKTTKNINVEITKNLNFDTLYNEINVSTKKWYDHKAGTNEAAKISFRA